jgi:hypothetical protein
MLSRNVQVGILLLAVFAISFLAVFLVIFFTQSAYSTPVSGLLSVGEMRISAGPPPDSTGVSVDTTITVDAVASASLDDLVLAPETPIARMHSETTGPLTYLSTFCPAQLLKPQTLYTVSVTVMGDPVTWSFTTTPEPFKPGMSFYLATNAPWIALMAAAASTIVAGLVLRYKMGL